jgi:nicotinamidase-related amidase
VSAWHEYLGANDLEVLARARFSRRSGFGERPAVLVIDAQRYMVGQEGADDAWPSSCGAAGRVAMDHIASIVHAAQSHGVPCYFTRFELKPDGSDMGVYRRKRDLLDSPHWCLAGSVGAQLSPMLVPSAGDAVYVKTKPSAFHGTPLLASLIDRKIDTLVIVGGATSNCIRATVFDAASWNFRAIVPEEAVFDRFGVSHAISLFDMDRQFADVVPAQEVLGYLQANDARRESAA